MLIKQSKVFKQLRFRIRTFIENNYDSNEHSPQNLADMINQVIEEFMTENNLDLFRVE